MGEFWKRTWEPDGPVFGTPEQWGYDTVRQAASAAHIYGRKICAAEAFTSFAEDWIEDPWCLKDVGDAAFCNGLTRMVFHKFTHQPQLEAVPGFQWGHVGTHINLNTTWWSLSHGWLRYLQRCQFMLRQGLFVADVAYFYGEDANRFVRSKSMMTPPLPAGFDCDTLNAEVLLNRVTAENGRLRLPDGLSYRYLVLPHTNAWQVSPPVLRKIAELVEAGVTVIGPPPALHAPGLTDYPACDREVRRWVERLWGTATADQAPSPERRIGKGRILATNSLAAVIHADGLATDIEFRDSTADAKFDWIHRRSGDTDIYFVSNQKTTSATCQIIFRITGRQPELWDPVTGEVRQLPEFREAGGRTQVPMRFAPRQSFFVVFRKAPSESRRGQNFPESRTLVQLTGPWEVSFDHRWGGPEKVSFAKLEDWTQRSEAGIRYYSGRAIYRQAFNVEPQNSANARTFLNLGAVKNLANVKLNGRDLGVIWTAPWRVEITGIVRPGENDLEIAVVNLWPNRLIGDAKLPPERRFTRTNVKTYSGLPMEFKPPGGCKFCEARQQGKDPDASLQPSGLLGPVTIEQETSSPP